MPNQSLDIVRKALAICLMTGATLTLAQPSYPRTAWTTQSIINPSIGVEPDWNAIQERAEEIKKEGDFRKAEAIWEQILVSIENTPRPDDQRIAVSRKKYAKQSTPAEQTGVHFNAIEITPTEGAPANIKGIDRKDACTLSQELPSIINPESYDTAKECFNKAQEELEAAYKSENWAAVIRASKEAIRISEWLNLQGENNVDRITGIGVHITRESPGNETIILDTTEDSPAERAGLRKGDIIAAIDNKDASNITLDQITSLVRGEEGSSVLITIRRNGINISKRVTRAAVQSKRPRMPIGSEYSMLHHAYYMLGNAKEARAIYKQAQKEILTEFGADSEQLLTLQNSQSLLNLTDRHNKTKPLVNAFVLAAKSEDPSDKEEALWTTYSSTRQLLAAGEYEKAAEKIDNSLTLYKPNNKSKDAKLSEELAKDIAVLATFCKYSKIDQSQCRRYSEISYEMAIKHLKPSQVEYKGALWARAETLSETEPVEAWLPLYKRVIALESKYANNKTRTTTLTAIAMKLATTDTDEAVRLQSRATKLMQEEFGENSFEALAAQTKVGDIYRFGGFRDSAYNIYADTYLKLQILPGSGEYADGMRLQIYNALVKGLFPLGKTELVGKLLNKAIEVSARYPEELGAQLALTLARSNHAFAVQDHKKALAHNTDAVQLFKNIEEAYISSKAPDQGWLKGIRRSELRSARINLYEDTAAIHAMMHDYKSATSTIMEAIKYIIANRYNDEWKIKYLYASLARYQAAQSNLAAAEESSKEALRYALSDKAGYSPDDFYLLAGGIAGLRKKPEDAYQNFMIFTDARGENLSARLWQNSNQSKRIELVDTALEGLEYLFYDYGDSPYYPKAALYARLNLHGLSAELERKKAELAASDPKVKALLARIQKAAKQVVDPSLSIGEKEDLYKEIKHYEGLVLGRMPSLAHRRTSIEEVSESLPSNAVLIEFQKVSSYPAIDRIYPIDHPKTSRYIALSLDSQGKVRRFDLGDARTIDRSIRQAIDSLSSGHTDSAELWAEAGALLLAPMREVIATKFIIYISPDSEISLFPFASAEVFNPDGIFQPGTQIRVVTTGRDILRLTQAATAQSKPAVIANPTYSLNAKNNSSHQNAKRARGAVSLKSRNWVTWDALPATDKEGLAVSSLISAELLSKDMANEYAVKKLVSPRVLHFASHAFFSQEAYTPSDENDGNANVGQFADLSAISPNHRRNPASKIHSGIVLAGANDQPQNQDLDGYLMADEIARAGWSGTELVVISGCDSALGISRSGDGLYGLRRSIAVAGARSSLLSHWKVEDVATAEFMTRFYTRLKAGSSRSDALAATQNDFRDGIAGNGQWKDPYYWSGWQLIGDWRPIPDL
jgi:hypothetical protein